MDVSNIVPEQTLLQAAEYLVHLQRVLPSEFPIVLSPSSSPQREFLDISKTLLKGLRVKQEADPEWRQETDVRRSQRIRNLCIL